jgi:hypothetical protein
MINQASPFLYCAGGLPLRRFGIRGVGGLALRVIPLVFGVGAPDMSSSFTADGRLRLFEAGDVFALGPLDPVPCWLCCICIPGACM